MKLLAGSSNLPFAESLSRKMELPLTEVEISQFPNGEKRVWIKEMVKGENVILVQSFSAPTDEHVMECLLLMDALERMGARHVNLVVPWLGYSLQDKVFRSGEPIAAKVIANLISNTYVKRVFLLDLHNSSTPGFFSVPTQHLSAINLYVEYVKNNFELQECVVASPDFGGLKRARVFAELLGLPLINIDKHRDLNTGAVQALGISGDANGKKVLLFDDVINGGGTVVSCADILKQNGAKEVHFLATHGPLVESGLEKIEHSNVDSVVVTNSVHHLKSVSKVKILDTTSIFAEELVGWWKAR